MAMAAACPWQSAGARPLRVRRAFANPPLCRPAGVLQLLPDRGCARGGYDGACWQPRGAWHVCIFAGLACLLADLGHPCSTSKLLPSVGKLHMVCVAADSLDAAAGTGPTCCPSNACGASNQACTVEAQPCASGCVLCKPVGRPTCSVTCGVSLCCAVPDGRTWTRTTSRRRGRDQSSTTRTACACPTAGACSTSGMLGSAFSFFLLLVCASSPVWSA